MNLRTWTIDEADLSKAQFSKTIYGILTPKRLYLLYKWVQANDIGRIPVAPEFHAAGFLCAQYARLEIEKGYTKIYLAYHFDI